MSPDEFENRFGPEFPQGINPSFQTPPPAQAPDPGPYGYNPHTAQKLVKTGLTPRGKAALALGGAILAGGSLLTWQHYSAVDAANSVKAQQLEIQKERLDLEKLKTLGQVNQAQQKTQTAADTARQKQVDTCVNANKGLVGKQLGATYRSVLDDCQAQYPATTSSNDMQAAADSQSTGSGSGGGAKDGLLIGGGVLVVGAWIVVRKATRNNTNGYAA